MLSPSQSEFPTPRTCPASVKQTKILQRFFVVHSTIVWNTHTFSMPTLGYWKIRGVSSQPKFNVLMLFCVCVFFFLSPLSHILDRAGFKAAWFTSTPCLVSSRYQRNVSLDTVEAHNFYHAVVAWTLSCSYSFRRWQTLWAFILQILERQRNNPLSSWYL